MTDASFSAETKEGINNGKSPAIRYADRTWNDKSSGVNITFSSPKVLITCLRPNQKSDFRMNILDKHFAFDLCSATSWLTIPTFLGSMEEAIIQMQNIHLSGGSSNQRERGNRF